MLKKNLSKETVIYLARGRYCEGEEQRVLLDQLSAESTYCQSFL